MRYSSLGGHGMIAMQYDLLALHALRGVQDVFLPWSDSALRPAAIQIVVNEIFLNERKRAVEFGCGVSTVYSAAMLAKKGGRLISIDHDAEWIEKVTGWLTPQQRKIVRFIHAPLSSQMYERESVEWYDLHLVETGLDDAEAIDLVLVDGPPAYQIPNCLNRGPAISVLKGRLAPAATILLDDIDRAGEQRIAHFWSQILRQNYRALTIEAGVAIWKLGPGAGTSQ